MRECFLTNKRAEKKRSVSYTATLALTDIYFTNNIYTEAREKFREASN